MPTAESDAPAERRVLSPGEFLAWRRRLPGPPIALVTGTFDILQPGNWQALATAARCAPRVAVVLESDDVAAARPGGRRPINDLATRAEFLAHCRLVEAITSVSPGAACAFFEALRPYTWVVGRDGRETDVFGPAVGVAAERVTELPVIPGCHTGEIHAAVRGNRTPLVLPPGFPGGREDPASSGALRPPGDGTLGTVNGCFDILHIGHLRFLAQARRLADRLVVLLNDDASLRRYKGDGRPVFPLPFRVAALASLTAVDAVRPFSEDDPLRLLAEVRPDLHIKGGSYEEERVRQERDLMAQWGGRVEFCPLVEGYSTTAYIRKALGLAR